jgi:hypothetical protein
MKLKNCHSGAPNSTRATGCSSIIHRIDGVVQLVLSQYFGLITVITGFLRFALAIALQGFYRLSIYTFNDSVLWLNHLSLSCVYVFTAGGAL